MAEVIAQVALRKSGEELSRQAAESITTRQLADLALDVFGGWPEQRRQARSDDCNEALDGRHLRHLVEIAVAAGSLGMLIHRGRELGGDIQQARPVVHRDPKALQVAREGRSTGGQW